MAKERADEERRQKEEEEMAKYEAAMELKRSQHAAKQAGMTVSRVLITPHPLLTHLTLSRVSW